MQNISKTKSFGKFVLIVYFILWIMNTRHYIFLLIRNRSWILIIHKARILRKKLLNKSFLTFKKWVEKIQTAGYNGARTVYQLSSLYSPQICAINPMIQNSLKSIHSEFFEFYSSQPWFCSKRFRPSGTVLKLIGTIKFNLIKKGQGQIYSMHTLAHFFLQKTLFSKANFLKKLAGTNTNRPQNVLLGLRSGDLVTVMYALHNYLRSKLGFLNNTIHKNT